MYFQWLNNVLIAFCSKKKNEGEEGEEETKIWIAEIKVPELRHRWCENKAKPLIFVDFTRIFKKNLDFH